jgi:hypothetical protein
MFKKKYDMRDLGLFFDQQCGEFGIFNELIRNFERKNQDLKYNEPKIEEALTELKNMREEVNFLVLMMRVYNNISEESL